MRLSKLLISSFLIALAGQTALPWSQAATIYYESFSENSYPTSYLGTSPETGGNWTQTSGNVPNDQIVTGSMSTIGTLALPAAGGKLNILNDDNTRGTSVTTSAAGADGTTVFASFLIDIPGPGTSAFSGVEMWDAAPSSGDVNRSIRAGWTGSNYAVQTNRGTGSVALDAGQNFVVLQFNYVSGNDTVDVYVNPTLGELLGGTYDGQLTGGNFSFDRIGLGNNNDAGLNGFADEIRVGTLLSDVAVTSISVPVPEPSAFVLLSFGLILLRSRRSRN